MNIILGAGAGPIVQGHFLIVPTPAEESLNWAIKIGGWLAQALLLENAFFKKTSQFHQIDSPLFRKMLISFFYRTQVRS